MGTCSNSAVINAPLDDVWAAIRNFHNLDWAPGVITQVDSVGDVPGDQVGARRVLNGAFHETLKSIDEEAHAFTYSIDDGNVRFGFAHPKQILDIYRVLCSGKTEVHGQLCNLFDHQTNHGSDMNDYDHLLQKAVDSLATTFRKQRRLGPSIRARFRPARCEGAGSRKIRPRTRHLARH